MEDTELGRWALGRALETAGFKVQAVSSWAEASVYLVRERFSLVILSASLILGDVGGAVGDFNRDHPEAHLILLADQDSIGELRPVCGPAAHILPKPLDLEKLAVVAASRSGVA